MQPDVEATWTLSPTSNDQEESIGTSEEQVQVINLFSETSGEEVGKLRGQRGTDPRRMIGHLVAGTVPEKWEIQQGRLQFDRLVFLIPTM